MTDTSSSPPLSARQGALVAIVASTVAIAVAYGTAFFPNGSPRWAAPLFVFGTAGLLVGAMVLGAARPARRLGPVTFAFGFVWLVIAGGFGAVLALDAPSGADTELWMGLPLRVAIIVYGIGLLPALVLPLAYALTFDSITLSDDDLARVRAACHAAQSNQRRAGTS
ncbi:MAG: hypothetical protein ABI637_02895 [Gemmatimonadota bacterium]